MKLGWWLTYFLSLILFLLHFLAWKGNSFVFLVFHLVKGSVRSFLFPKRDCQEGLDTLSLWHWDPAFKKQKACSAIVLNVYSSRLLSWMIKISWRSQNFLFRVDNHGTVWIISLKEEIRRVTLWKTRCITELLLVSDLGTSSQSPFACYFSDILMLFSSIFAEWTVISIIWGDSRLPPNSL